MHRSCITCLDGGQLRAVHLAPLAALVALRPLVLPARDGIRIVFHQRAAVAAPHAYTSASL